MRPIHWVPVLCLAAVLAVRGEDPKPEVKILSINVMENWSGSETGDWIVRERRLRSFGPENLAFKRRYEFVQTAERGAEIVESWVDPQGEERRTSRVAHSHEYEASCVATGVEDIVIDGRAVSCEIFEARPTKSRPGTMKSWRASVEGQILILKQEIRSRRGRNSLGDSTMTVLKLKEDVKVGDRTFSCRVVEWTSSQCRGIEYRRYWLTPDLPGGIARETESDFGGQLTGETVTLSFGKKE